MDGRTQRSTALDCGCDAGDTGVGGGGVLSMNNCASPPPDRADAVAHDCGSLTSVLLFLLLFLPCSTEEKDKNNSRGETKAILALMRPAVINPSLDNIELCEMNFRSTVIQSEYEHR